MVEKVFDLLDEMEIKPDSFTLAILFNACAELANDRAIKIGRKLLDEMPENYRNDNAVLNSAMHMLMKFGDIQSAERIFRLNKKKDIITYNAIIKGYVGNKMFEKALDLFEQIHLNLDNVTYIIVFNACAGLANDRAIKIGRKLLDEMPENYRNDNAVLNSAMHMLMKFGDIQSAERIFRLNKKKDIITSGAMMKGYVGNKMFEKALDLFEQIHLNLNNVTYIIVFNACAGLANDRAIKIGRKLLDEMPENYRNDNAVLNSAMHMLMKFGDIQGAERIFRLNKKKDIITYNAIMNGYNLNDESSKCFKILDGMSHEGIVPNETTWNILIGACSQIGMIHRCEYIIDQIPLDTQNKRQIQNSLIDMWGKCGSVEKAQIAFKSIDDRDTVTYNTMINAFGLNGMGSEAIHVYKQMPNDLRDEVSHICVLNACSHSGLLHEARNIFDEITFKTEKIITTMIDCLSRLFLFDEAQKLIDNYEKTNKPYLIMYMSLLSGARNNRNRHVSEKVYDRMKYLFPNEKQHLVSGAVLVSNIYSSFGEDQLATTFRSNQIKQLRTNATKGLSWTQINDEIVQFTAHDNSHPQASEIDSEIDRMTSELIQHGYKFDSSWITRKIKDGETIQSVLCGHSEKKAIALNFIQRPVPKFIQIAKNLRV
ncbi:unnamed protein product, partial [Rotaria magnacalcarata]